MIRSEKNKICKSPFTLINFTSSLVLLISLYFAYQYFVPLNSPIDNSSNNEANSRSNDQASHQRFKDESKIDKSNTFIDKFKKTDLSQFIHRDTSTSQFTVSHIDQFNNNQLLPRLRSIVEMDYFKYIKLDLNKKCTLWPDDAKCSRQDCTIRTCDESRLPDYIINDSDNEHHKQLNNRETFKECNEDQVMNSTSEQLQQIVTNVISNEKLSTMNELFECYVSEYEDGEFYDLKMNPEQYTGYKGPTAHRIWRSIYEENCFKSKKIQIKDMTEANAQMFESILNVDDLCLEEKIFYRAISGLHTSINIHLSRYYHFKSGSIGSNLKEFLKRFENKNEYLKNLYFVFLLELRALNKIGNYLLSKVNWQSSGDQMETREAIKDVLKIIAKFNWKFDENVINLNEFRNAQFAEHFRNISTTIMDCVACDKCKLWGKVQTHGLGTAFKILLTDFENKVQFNDFHLHRHEISTLFNAITRLSNSIESIHRFNELMKEKEKPSTNQMKGYKIKIDDLRYKF